jgi:uncharacterized protein
VRVAFDTSVLVSAVATRGICSHLFNLVLAEHELIVGGTVLSEVQKVLRQKFRVSDEIIGEFDALLRAEALIVSKAKTTSIAVRDKSDMAVLAEATGRRTYGAWTLMARLEMQSGACTL